MVMKFLSVHGVVISALGINQTIAQPNTPIFLAIVLDKQTNGATISSENVFKNVGGTAETSVAPMRNLQYIQRFEVLKTLLLDVNYAQSVYDGTNVEVGQVQVPFKMNVKLNDIPVMFSGTTESVANIVDNSLHFIAYSNVRGNLLMKLWYGSRLRFVG